jgi:hypothetical protein
MTDPDVLTEPPVAGDEVAAVVGILERNRRTFAWKTGGLDSDGLRVTTAASTMTLGGLVKHLALVEADWFAVKLRGESLGEPWSSVDWEADADWEWTSAAYDTPEQLYALWNDAVTRSRRLVAEALVEGGLDQPARFTWPDGRTPNMRRVMLDMIEEYARHVGHADLIRESVDGLVGEDAPR